MATAISEETGSRIADIVMDSALERIQRWIDLCYQFRKWEREAIILGNPSPEDVAKHKKALATILKSTRFMLTIASDPESFDSDLYSKLSILHDQLQHSWQMLYHPPTSEESSRNEALLAELFPE
jgi:hypothetical protein